MLGGRIKMGYENLVKMLNCCRICMGRCWWYLAKLMKYEKCVQSKKVKKLFFILLDRFWSVRKRYGKFWGIGWDGLNVCVYVFASINVFVMIIKQVFALTIIHRTRFYFLILLKRNSNLITCSTKSKLFFNFKTVTSKVY